MLGKSWLLSCCVMMVFNCIRKETSRVSPSCAPLLMLGCILAFLGHFSTITLTFSDKGGETEIRLEGRGIPANEEERTREGWQRYYFEGIKQTFGYGARLF